MLPVSQLKILFFKNSLQFSLCLSLFLLFNVFISYCLSMSYLSSSLSFTQLCHLFATIAFLHASALATCNCRRCSCNSVVAAFVDISIYIFFNAFHHYWCCNFINRSDVAPSIRPRFLRINFSFDWSGWIIIQLKLDLSPCFPHICLRLLWLSVCLIFYAHTQTHTHI